VLGVLRRDFDDVFFALGRTGIECIVFAVAKRLKIDDARDSRLFEQLLENFSRDNDFAFAFHLYPSLLHDDYTDFAVFSKLVYRISVKNRIDGASVQAEHSVVQ